MIKFRPQTEYVGRHHFDNEQIQTAEEDRVNTEVEAEPLEEYHPEHIEHAKQRHGVQRELKVLRRRKLGDWMHDKVEEWTENIKGAVQNTKTFVKEKVLDKAFPGATEAVTAAYEWVRDSSLVKAIEGTGLGMRTRLFLLKNGPQAGLEPKIQKGQSQIEYLKQRQQQEVREFDRVASKFKGQDVSIEKAKQEKAAYWQARIDKEEAKQKALEAKLEAKKIEMEKLTDGINNRIDNKIKKIELSVNYDSNKQNQKELIKEIGELEALQKKSQGLYKELADINKQLLREDTWKNAARSLVNLNGPTGYERSYTEIFDEKRIAEEEKGMTDVEKESAKQARSVIEKNVKDGKVSLENILQQNEYKLTEYKEQLAILDSHLTKLRSAKAKVDSVCIKTEHRVATWENHRKELGVDRKNNNVGQGEYVKTILSKKDMESLTPTIDSNRDVLINQKNNPEHWFGSDALEKTKNDGVDVGLNEAIVTGGLFKMKQMAEQTVLNMNRAIAYMEVPTADSPESQEIQKNKKELEDMKSEDKKIQKEMAEIKRKNPKNPSDEARAAYKDLEEKSKALKDQIEALDKKIKDASDALVKDATEKSNKKAEYIRDRDLIQKDVIEKMTVHIPEDVAGQARSWTKIKEILYEVFPDLQQYESEFKNKDNPPFVPGVPESATSDAVDADAEKVLQSIYGKKDASGMYEKNDLSHVYENLVIAIGEVKNNPDVKDENREGVANVLLSEAVDVLLQTDEYTEDSIEKSIELLDLINQENLSGSSTKVLAGFINEHIKNIRSEDFDSVKLLLKFGKSLESSVSAGKIDHALASELYTDSVFGMESNIAGEDSNTKAERMANFALHCVKKGSGLIGRDDIYKIFEHAMQTAKNESNVDLSGYLNKNITTAEEGSDISSANELKNNTTFFQKIKYIQDKMMKAGLESLDGYAKSNIEPRKNALIKKAEAGDVGAFTNLSLFATELALKGQYDYAVEIAYKASEVAKHDPYKLIELATIISSAGKDMGPVALSIFEQAYNLADADNSDKLRFEILEGVMSSDNLFVEGFDSNIEQKFDKIFEKNKNDFMMMWSTYESLTQVKSSSVSGAKGLIGKMIEKTLLRAEVLAKTGSKENYVSDQERTAKAMREEGMETDARRIEIQLETQRLKAENEARAEAVKNKLDVDGESGDKLKEDADAEILEKEPIFDHDDYDFINDVEAPNADSDYGDAMLPLRRQGYGQGTSRNPLAGNPIGTEGNSAKPKKKGFLSSLFGGLLSLFGIGRGDSGK